MAIDGLPSNQLANQIFEQSVHGGVSENAETDEALRELLDEGKGQAFLSSYRNATIELHQQVREGEISIEKGQTVAWDLFQRYAQILRGMAPDDEALRELLIRTYEQATVNVEGRHVRLAEPYLERDTSGDGVRDIDAIARPGGHAATVHTDLAAIDANLAMRKSHDLMSAIHLGLDVKADGTLPNRTYFGDQGNALVPEDGYLRFEAKRFVPRSSLPAYPQDLTVRGGSVTTTSLQGTNAVRIEMGGTQILGMPRDDGRIDFYELSATQPELVVKNGHLVGKGGEIKVGNDYYPPLSASDASQQVRDLMQVYQEAFRVANDGDARLSPASYDDRVAQVHEEILPNIEATIAEREGRAAARVEALTNIQARQGNSLQAVNETLGRLYDRAAHLDAAEALAVYEDADGFVTLGLGRQPDGMSLAELNDLRDEFGEELAEFQAELRAEQERLEELQGRHERGASDLLRSVRSPAYQSHIASLPPEERAVELASVAQAVSGTAAGERFAGDIKAAFAEREEAGEPSSAVHVLMRNLPESEKGRAAMGDLALTIANDLEGSDADAFATAFEMITGREPTEAEQNGIRMLTSASTPAQFNALTGQGPVRMPSSTAGDASTVIGTLADHMEGTRSGDALGRTSHYLALFQLSRSTANLLSSDRSAVDAAQFSVDALQTFGTWAELAHRSGSQSWVVQHGRYAGHAGNIAGVALDFYNLSQQESPEGRKRALGQTLAGAAMVAGTTFGGPVGWGVAGVAFAARIAIGSTSAEYEQAYGALRDHL